MVEGKRITINGTDYTDYFTRIGYSVHYESVQGSNADLMLDGSYTEDELKLRAVVTLPCMPLDEERLSNILQEVYSGSYHIVEYFDIKTRSYKTEEMRRQVSEQTYKGQGANGLEYWTGTVVTFTTR